MINKKAVTLTELLVGSILVGIIMIGIVAFNATLARMEASSNRSTVLAMRALPVLSYIRQNASLAVGDQSKPGVYTNSTPVDVCPECALWMVQNPGKKFVSIRVDADDNPSSYQNDNWMIYVADLNATSPRKNTIFLCKPQPETIAGGIPFFPRMVGANPNCSAANSTTLLNNVTEASFDRFIDSNWSTGGAAEARLYLKIHLKMLFDPTQSYDPTTNPEYKLDTSVAPISHSW